MLLEDDSISAAFAGRMDQMGVFGTLILHGPVYEKLGKWFMNEFEKIPRIGARNWDEEDVANGEIKSDKMKRELQEKKDELLWTSANVRGLVLVKFGAREVEGVKRWLSAMLKAEGTVEKAFGERALLCLR